MSEQLVALLFDHECQAGMKLDTSFVKEKLFEGGNTVLREQFARAFAYTENVKHGHVAFVELDDRDVAVDKVFV